MIFISLFFHSCKFLIKLLIKSKDPFVRVVPDTQKGIRFHFFVKV
ncbi:hypothetical protein COPCOM_01687 [Coprococcus comes ATCC 27758]|uniref:Uncharacterized protein n=1 Tax=Coprococcus comes ATCC 27758 TaxID=470146 RepID=C0B961_9FIRM|nr:hypothetical protein COPCOM_01687 [Coprococcus comes ATCC 27758]